jgi:hypothetical protein
MVEVAQSSGGAGKIGDRSAMTSPSRLTVLLKNVVFVAAAAGIWLALQTGYVSPDRPTRAQWTEYGKARSELAGQVVLQTDFKVARIDSGPNSPWGYYNKATSGTVTSDESGVTVHYKGTAWIGAQLDIGVLRPGAVYRISIVRDVVEQPGAVLVRNRQRDLVREVLPVGKGTTVTHFIAPPGKFERLLIAFIPDARSNPQGSMKILSVKVERMGGGS